jgi:HAD superfamily hydrolase (TIGR01509 family)
MIKAIIFDFAGVIGAEAYWNWLRKKIPNLDNKKHYFEEIANKVDKGTISEPEFVEAIAKEIHLPHEKIREEIFQELVINDGLLTLIKSLKKHYKIGLLSNYSHVWLEKILDVYHLQEYFDEIFISSRHGFIKPEVEAFQTILSKLHVSINEAVFTDDRQDNVDAGNKIGLKSFLYKNNEKLKQDLLTYGVNL